MNERVKRPKLERTEPIRSWSTLLGGASAIPGAGAGRAPSDSSAAAAGSGAGALSDMITRSVDLGYRVIDEYVRQGQRAAERMTGRAPDPAALTGDMQEISARMAQYSSELMGLWFQAMAGLASATPNAWVPTPAAPPSASAAVPPSAAAAPAGEPLRVRVEVASVQPVEVGVDVRPGAVQRSLIVHTLRAVDSSKPALSATVVPNGDEGVLCLRVHVPDDQPTGIYSGLLIDQRSSLPVGAVSVRVGGA